MSYSTPTRAYAAALVRSYLRAGREMHAEGDARGAKDARIFARRIIRDAPAKAEPVAMVAQPVQQAQAKAGYRGAAPLEMAHMLVVSTGHVTAETRDLLDVEADAVPVTYQKGEYGWFVNVPSEDGCVPPDCPDELRALLAFARENGAHWLMLDCDADAIETLPVFDW